MRVRPGRVDTVTELSITVYGTPAPQGSKRHVGRGIMVESSKALKPWREAVKYAALDAIPAGGPYPLTGPVRVTATFAFTRPRSHYRTGKHADLLKPDAPTLHAQTPDLDKIVRSTLDALVYAGVMRDDKQVACIDVVKLWHGLTSQARITVNSAVPT